MAQVIQVTSPSSRTFRTMTSMAVFRVTQLNEENQDTRYSDEESSELFLEQDDIPDDLYIDDELCLCDIYAEELCDPELEDLFEILENNVKLESGILCPSENISYECLQAYSDAIPDWLKQASPSYTAARVSVSPTPSESDSLKEKSVQHLLGLADEAEKRFNQRAEEINKLENILSRELISLERDIRLVSEIQKTIGDSSDTETRTRCQTEAIVDNLIDFSIEGLVTSCSEEMKVQSDGGFAPQVTSHLQNRIATDGTRVRLACFISGNPDPEITWLKNGKSIAKKRRYVYSTMCDYGFCSLDIYNCKITDSGAFSCVANNCFGRAISEAYLTVTGSKEFSPEAPQFMESPEDLLVNEGTCVNLQWTFGGTPFPSVIWYKNAEKLLSSLRIDTFVSHKGTCRLYIRDVTVEDSGIYTCLVENDAGSILSTVFLSVAGSDC